MRDHLLLDHPGLEAVAEELKWAQHPGDLGLHPWGALFPPCPALQPHGAGLTPGLAWASYGGDILSPCIPNWDAEPRSSA